MERDSDVERVKLRGEFSSENVWTAFVDHLSKRVSRRELRELFSSHGPVVRVFIPRETRNPKYKFFTFAFVHFGNEESLRRAIAKLNGSMIDGWRISVGTARYKDARVRSVGKNTSLVMPSRSNTEDLSRFKEKGVINRSVRDTRSYKEALLSDRLKNNASDHRDRSIDGFNRRKGIKIVGKCIFRLRAPVG
ncbi:serine/arginine-rich splicing factor SC35-like [Hibiscus syriacus]|uniref:serine/arginine-rich splicing factor SC35-like n=1 Tax=Hibiscus syriacus TaxID=106335 RepID=UPI0019244C29|nr:serine/arginine-rich splicing factor SC35-like [Hibiscus syriacus]